MEAVVSELPEESSGEQGVALERAVRLGQLLDLYGPLLTDRQRQFVKLHFEDDLSFGEIAKEFGISRQAIHDAVKHAEQSLEEYDAKLHLAPGSVRRRDAKRGEAAGDLRQESSAAAKVEGLGPVVGLLEEIHGRLRRSGGVIYNAEGITRDLGDALERLKQLQVEE